MDQRTHARLQKTLEYMTKSSYENVPGVVVVDSGRPGPVLGITACTHGNEPVGIAVIDHLLRALKIEKELKKGKLFLVVNNIRAARAFFLSQNEDEKKNARYVNVNMNRLPPDTLRRRRSRRYEIRRARELYPIWSRFTHGLDIHSMSVDRRPMIIGRRNAFHRDLVRGIPIDCVITNIDRVQIGKPAFSFYGGKDSDALVFAIEAGVHEKTSSFEVAKIATEALLKNLGMLRGRTKDAVREYEEYRIAGSIIVNDLSYRATCEDFALMPRNALLARGKKGTKDRRAGFVCQPILITPQKTIRDLREEMMFLSRPVIRHAVK